jgi:YHS domain-containing protein
MKHSLALLAVAAGLALFVATGCAKKQQPAATDNGTQKQDAAAAVEGKPQTTCPVMGSKIDKSLYVDVKGKRIYVCCQTCVAAVKKDPDTYIAKLQQEGVKIADAPK